jgi:hypothetical protein
MPDELNEFRGEFFFFSENFIGDFFKVEIVNKKLPNQEKKIL